MNKGIATSGLAVVVTAAALSSPMSAHAASVGCVTKADYNKANPTMTMNRVHTIFGTAGKLEVRTTGRGVVTEIRSYHVCGSPLSSVVAGFDSAPGDVPRIMAKSAAFITA